MESNKEYFAFISYKSEDVEWATWLQHELEHYHLPASFNGRTDVPQELRPVFRDIDELSAGNLPEQIKQALVNSQNLIVICSPQAAKSPWVNQEVETFIALGRTGRIFPFIVEGNSPSEFFPPALRELPKDKERLGGDVSKKGRDAAFVKVVAGMLGVGFDSLWNRYEKEKAEEERKQREQRDRLMISQSRFLAEKANDLVDEGDSYTARLLALEALPKDINNPERPYVTEAEIALRKASQSNTAILRGHTDKVTFIALSPDGRVIASASFDGTIRLWDIKIGQTVKELPIKKMPLFAVSISPDGQYIAYSYAVDEDCSIYIWNLNKNCHQCVLKGHESVIRSISFSHDGSSLVTASNDGTVRIWDIIKEECKKVMRDDGKFVLSVVYSPDDSCIAAASYDKYVRIWSAVSGKLIHKLEGHTDIVTTVSFNLDGGMLASGSEDNTICIWDTNTWKCKRVLKGHNRFVTSTVFSPDGLFLVSGSLDGTIRFWETEEGQCVCVLKGHTDRVNTVLFHQGGQLVISSSDDATIRIWEIFGDEPESVSLHDASCFKSSPENSDRTLIAGVDGYSEICVMEKGSKTILRKGYGHIDDICCVVFSPDDKYIASASLDKTVRIWDANTLECIHVLKGHTTAVMDVSFSPDGKHVVSTSPDNTIRVWDVSTGICLFVIDNEFKSGSSFTTDGCHIISNFSDDSADVWKFPPIQELIDDNRERLKNRQLTSEERKRFYLE